MRVATWNLRCVRPGAGSRSERLRAALDAIAPDIWVLTEAHPDFVSCVTGGSHDPLRARGWGASATDAWPKSVGRCIAC